MWNLHVWVLKTGVSIKAGYPPPVGPLLTAICSDFMMKITMILIKKRNQKQTKSLGVLAFCGFPPCLILWRHIVGLLPRKQRNYSRLPTTRTFRANRKWFALSEVRVIEGIYRKWPERKWKLLRVTGRFEFRKRGFELWGVSCSFFISIGCVRY